MACRLFKVALAQCTLPQGEVPPNKFNIDHVAPGCSIAISSLRRRLTRSPIRVLGFGKMIASTAGYLMTIKIENIDAGFG